MTVFTIENREFGWDEIVAAAQIWGEWQPFVDTVRQSLACLRQAQKTGPQAPPSQIREAATAFRYAHNLISAEDAKSWLASWELTVESWMSYLTGQLLRECWARRLNEIVAYNPVSDHDVAEVVRNYAVCSDKLAEWAIKLAGRAAIATKFEQSGEGREARTESPSDLVFRIEADFEEHRKQAVTPKLIETKIADHRLDWIHFKARYVWFPERRIASEAAWCLIEDGLSLDEVAYDARGIVQQWDFYLDEIEAAVRSRFLAARAGDWVGPIKMIEGYPLFSIIAKTMPATSDPQILERAEHAIVANSIQRAINERVKWVTLG